MRTYGRITQPDGSLQWVQVSTDANGYDDNCWITTLIQCIKLNLNECPFNANYGIPAQQSVLTQIFPDFYMFQLQSLFQNRFASLIITKLPSSTPTYNIALTTHQGSTISMEIAT
jgi:hypothetical protein